MMKDIGKRAAQKPDEGVPTGNGSERAKGRSNTSRARHHFRPVVMSKVFGPLHPSGCVKTASWSRISAQAAS